VFNISFAIISGCAIPFFYFEGRNVVKKVLIRTFIYFKSKYNKNKSVEKHALLEENRVNAINS